jgi:archaeosine synthase alpha-subunit
MEHKALARTVMARWRHARIFGLGDRALPDAFTPGLCLTSNDPVMGVEMAPFMVEHNSEKLPASLKITARGNWSYPFGENDIPEYTAIEGHTLPPSLQQADSGQGQSTGPLLPITWQRLVHDATLLDADLAPEIIVLQDALQLAGHPGKLVQTIRLIRERFPAALLWAPGLGGPDNCAILSWFGLDLFDLRRSQQAAAHGILLTRDGPRPLDTTTGESADISTQISEWKTSLSATRSAIQAGTLRELVEKQSLNSPRLVEHLRRHDALLSSSAPLSMHVEKAQRFRCHSSVSREDPIVQDWIHRMENEYMPSEIQRETLVLLPCSARKPYSSSQSHRFFRSAIRNRRIHQVMVTSPLGLVPRELEEQWPAAHYDLPVTGDWDDDELATIRRMVKTLVERVGYKTVINHSGIDFDIPTIDTRPEGVGASSKAACDVLRKAIESIEGEHMREKSFLKHAFASLSRWQFGTDAWMEGLRVGGKPPRWMLMKDKQQMAQWHPDSGRFSFTKSILPTLRETGTLREVEIGGDSPWKGDIFPAMVLSAPSDLKIGEEILIIRNGELLGSARCKAAGWEWKDGVGRLAKSQHRL